MLNITVSGKIYKMNIKQSRFDETKVDCSFYLARKTPVDKIDTGTTGFKLSGVFKNKIHFEEGQTVVIVGTGLESYYKKINEKDTFVSMVKTSLNNILPIVNSNVDPDLNQVIGIAEAVKTVAIGTQFYITAKYKGKYNKETKTFPYKEIMVITDKPLQDVNFSFVGKVIDRPYKDGQYTNSRVFFKIEETL